MPDIDDFSYIVWPPGTQVTLVNVPWNNDYRDLVKFDTVEALNAYIDGRATSGITINNTSYVRPGENVFLNIPINRANRFNYLRVYNPAQPVEGNDQPRYYYYFILDVRHVAPNTTEFVLQLDIWTSWNFYMSFGNCYIERGHIGIANTKQLDHNGRDYLTTPEGIDTGSEYTNIYRKTEGVISSNLNGYNVVVCSTIDLLADAGTVSDPKLKTATGSSIYGVASGATYYAWQSGEGFRNWLNSVQDQSWMTQGIISVLITPDLNDWGQAIPWPADAKEPYRLLGLQNTRKTVDMFTNWRNSPTIINAIPPRYRHLKKFFTYPYMAIELTMWSATPIIVKPESWQNADARIETILSVMLPGAKIAAYPDDYNATNPTTGEDLNFATQLSNLPQTIAINNGAIAWIAANRNSIAFQHQSADWSQQRALASAQTSYDQASSGINMANELTAIGMDIDTRQTQNTTDAAIMNTGIGAAQSIIGGATGGAAFGPVGAGGGMIGGTINAAAQAGHTAVNNAAQWNALTNRNAGAQMSNQARVGNAAYLRDTNQSFAQFAAKGDYENSIAAINAKVNDANLIQPTVSGQMGGETFLLAAQRLQIAATWKIPSLNALTMVGEFWLRYGYAINRFAVPPESLKVMTRFTYWKLKETYVITSTMPESFKQAIRGIFEKGVTVWNNPDDIGTIDIAENAALPGVTL